MLVRQPEFFENIVRLVKQLAIETIEIAEVMSVQFAALKCRDAFRDLAALFAHALQSEALSLKSKG